MLGEVIPDEGLTSILVNSLQNLASVNITPRLRTQVSNLVSCGVSKTREEGEELATSWRSSFVLEDDCVQLGGGGNLAESVNCFNLNYTPAMDLVPFRDCSLTALQLCRPSTGQYCAYHPRSRFAHTGWKTASSEIPADPTKSQRAFPKNLQSWITHLILTVSPE